nr:hypothetical protein [Sediminicoccus rosea]
MRLAEPLHDRASFRRFSGLAARARPPRHRAPAAGPGWHQEYEALSVGPCGFAFFPIMTGHTRHPRHSRWPRRECRSGWPRWLIICAEASVC